MQISTLLYKALDLHTWLEQKEPMMAWVSASQFQVCPLVNHFGSHVVITSCFDFLKWFSLYSTGHNLEEVVFVTSYFHIENKVKPCEGEASFKYVRDDAQEVAEYLSENRDQLDPQSFLEILKKFPCCAQGEDDELFVEQLAHLEQEVEINKSSADLRLLDEKITHALANMDYPQQWKTDGQPKEGNEMKRPTLSRRLVSGDFSNHFHLKFLSLKPKCVFVLFLLHVLFPW